MIAGDYITIKNNYGTIYIEFNVGIFTNIDNLICLSLYVLHIIIIFSTFPEYESRRPTI